MPVSGRKVTRGLFKIGDYVRVIATVQFLRSGSKRIADRMTRDMNVIGQVVGVAVRMEGDVIWEPDEGMYFAGGGPQHELWKIRLGMKNRSVLAFESDLAITDPVELPWLKIKQYRWTDADRAVISEESAAWPRDKKGRWAKGRKVMIS